MPQKKNTKQSKTNQNRDILLFILILLLAGLIYYFRSLFVVATVNNQPITRFAVIRDLEKRGGKETLNALVTKAVLIQEIKRRNINVSKDEADKEIKKIEASLQGQSIDQLLKAQGATREDFVEQIKIQKALEKMFDKDIKISEKEINDFIEKNKSLSPTKQVAEQQIKQQKLSKKVQDLLEDLKRKAKINYFVTY